ncbi:MAG TPA: type II toxin-antitoxin system death-on-curing family toxin [Lactobacillus sp.]|nr:type II toxin-antitoxin system death-on-curing family toxin [Lactobacillus sp.]
MIYLTGSEISWLNTQILVDETDLGIQYSQGLDLVAEQPKQVVFGRELYPTIWLKAAFILQKITKKHVFFDGNKRTALAATAMFLELNGFHLDLPRPQSIDFILFITQSKDTEDVMLLASKWIKQHSRKLT